MFLSRVPVLAPQLLWSSASSGLEVELWIVAVVLYFKNVAGSQDFLFCNLVNVDIHN